MWWGWVIQDNDPQEERDTNINWSLVQTLVVLYSSFASDLVGILINTKNLFLMKQKIDHICKT